MYTAVLGGFQDRLNFEERGYFQSGDTDNISESTSLHLCISKRFRDEGC